MKHLAIALTVLIGMTSACQAQDAAPDAAPGPKSETASPAAETVPVAEQKEAASPDSPAAEHPEARLYDASIDARQALEAALVRGRINNTLVLVALGANWCHDSRAFAGWMETDRFKALVAEKYELIYVNVGMPQSQDGHNLDIAARFGVKVEGTPTLLLLTPDGEILNHDTATSWRNAASRSEDEIYDELALMATTEIARD